MRGVDGMDDRRIVLRFSLESLWIPVLCHVSTATLSAEVIWGRNEGSVECWELEGDGVLIRDDW